MAALPLARARVTIGDAARRHVARWQARAWGGRTEWLSLAALAVLALLFLLPFLVTPVAFFTVFDDFDSDLAPYAALRHDIAQWQWNAAYGLGQPVPADPLSAIFNPLAACFLLVLGPDRGLGPLLWCCLFLSGVVAWLLCRDLGCRPAVAVFGALLFVWSGFVSAHLWAGHLEYALALPALQLAWLAGRRLATRTRLGIVLGATAVALPLLSGSVYIAEYATLVLATTAGVTALASGWRTVLARTLPGLGLSLLLGAALAAVHLLPMLSLYGQLVRLPVDASGSLPPWMLPLDLVMPPWLLAVPGVQLLIEQQPVRTVNWHELAAFLGPLALLPLCGLRQVWAARQGRQEVFQGCAVFIVGAALLDGRVAWLPPHWLFQVMPQALASRVPARALMVVTLALTALAALGLERLLQTDRPRARRLWVWVAILGLASLLPGNELLIVGRAINAAHEPIPRLPPLQGPAWVLVGEHVSQLALVEQGAVILNNYYGWHLPAALDRPTLDRLTSGGIWASGTLAPTAADGSSATIISPTVLLDQRRPTLPRAYLTSATGCAGLACPPLQPTTVDRWGSTTVVRAKATGGQTLVLAEAAVPGWRVRTDSSAWHPAPGAGGVLSTAALPGLHTYTFAYATPHLALGAAISGLGLLVALVLLMHDPVECCHRLIRQRQRDNHLG